MRSFLPVRGLLLPSALIAAGFASVGAHAQTGSSAVGGAVPGTQPRTLNDIPRAVSKGFGAGTEGVGLVKTFTFTHSDITIFGYHDNTQIDVFNSANVNVFSGLVNEGDHVSFSPGAGVYRIEGTEQYTVLVGDHLVSYVMGYYAIDEFGLGTSNKFYSYHHTTTSWTSTDYRNFIVFAYEDGTQVDVINTDTSAVIFSGVLNDGEHFADPTLSNVYVTVTGSNPVSVLSYTDQGYYVPAANGTFSGKRFHTWAGNSGSWCHDLQISGYITGTNYTVTDTVTSAVIATGTVDAGKVASVPCLNSVYLTVDTDQNVNVEIAPYGSWSGGYYHMLYGQDFTGYGIGSEMTVPSIAGSTIYLFSYQDGSITTVTNSLGTVVYSGTLNTGESTSFTSEFTEYAVDSTGLVSFVVNWGGAAGADFAPLLFAAPPAQAFCDTIVMDQARYTAGDTPTMTYDIDTNVSSQDVVVEERLYSLTDLATPIEGPFVNGPFTISGLSDELQNRSWTAAGSSGGYRSEVMVFDAATYGSAAAQDTCTVDFGVCPDVTYYGPGCVGTSGFEPVLTINGCPAIGETIDMVASQGLGAAHGCFFVGQQRASDSVVGCTVLVSLPLIGVYPFDLDGTPGLGGDGDLTYPVAIPNDIILVGQQINIGTVIADPGGPQNFSFTNAAEFIIGNLMGT